LGANEAACVVTEHQAAPSHVGTISASLLHIAVSWESKGRDTPNSDLISVIRNLSLIKRRTHISAAWTLLHGMTRACVRTGRSKDDDFDFSRHILLF